MGGRKAPWAASNPAETMTRSGAKAVATGSSSLQQHQRRCGARSCRGCSPLLHGVQLYAMACQVITCRTLRRTHGRPLLKEKNAAHWKTQNTERPRGRGAGGREIFKRDLETGGRAFVCTASRPGHIDVVPGTVPGTDLRL